jgi:hypothetical protein
VTQFRYLGTTITDQNLIHEEIKRRLNSGNAYCHSAHNLLSSRLLCINIKIKIYKTIILPVVLYGCETLSLTFMKENRMRVSENRVLRIFGPKWDEVTRGWRKLHNEELHNLYTSPTIFRMVKWRRRVRLAGRVARMGENRTAYRILVGKQEGKRPLGRPRRRWVDNIVACIGDYRRDSD